MEQCTHFRERIRFFIKGDNSHIPDNNLYYNEEMPILDIYYGSHMCVNTKAPVSDYYGRESKVWIENKYSNNLNEDFNHKFTFEQSTNPNYKPGI